MYSDPIHTVITGIGVLACNGIGREVFWKALEEGKSGIGLVNRFDTSEFPCKIAGQLWDFDAHQFLSKADVKRWNRTTHQAVAAAKMAVEDANFSAANYDPTRVAVGIGSSISSRDEEYDKGREVYETQGWEALDKFTSSASSAHAPTANVSAKLGLRGPAITIGSGCATGLDVIAWGMAQIREGRADAAIVGASETPLTKPVFACSSALGLLATNYTNPQDAMRPFDQSSNGLVLSESAVVLVLERADHAIRRGAPILAEIASSYSASEGSNPLILQRSGEAIARCVTGALYGAGMHPHELESIQSHGVGLDVYDFAESTAYKTALGDHAYRVPISAIKSMTGQPYSVGGLLGVTAGCMALTTGMIPPTINLNEPRENCDLDFVPNFARLNSPKNALVTSMSFGGTHSAIMLKKSA